MWEALEAWFAGSFMPHGHCYLWSPAMVWLQVAANLTIAVAYVSISATLAVILRRIRDIPFSRMYVAFGIFIVTCGLTHFLDIATIWHPVYWLDGGVRAVTALASAGTALMLVPLVPKAVALARAAETAHARGLELESTYRELATAHERTKALEQAKAELFANVSHELRTPLALVIGPTEKLLAGPELSIAQREELETIARNARTLLKHVNDLLDVAKLDVDHLEASYAHTDVAALVTRVTRQFEGLARERSVRLDVRVPAARKAEVDADLVERVVANLVGNAFKFGPRGGIVRVSLDSGATEEVRLEVADDGPGVPPALREHVFERFAQAEAGATRTHGGTGLGLAIVKDLVRLHGGKVHVEEAPEGGALFVVTMPARAPRGTAVAEAPPSEARADHRGSSSALEVATARAATRDADIRQEATLAMNRLLSRESPPTPSGGTGVDGSEPSRLPLVIVAEDNAEMNTFVSEALGEGYQVLRAHDGDQALALARHRRPDIVVTDVMMPARSGEELVAALRADADLADVPVLVLTALRDESRRVRMLEHGARDYVTKPFVAEELRARVGNLVATKRARDVLRSELASRDTDLERLASELGARKRELETAVTTLRVARDQAEQASRHKTDFLAMVSHELRTPLTTVQLTVDRVGASAGELPPKLQKNVERMSGAVRRLSSLVESLLHYARLQSGRVSVQRVPVDAHDIARDAVDEAQPLARSKGLELTLRVDDAGQTRPDLVIESDPTLLRLIVANLLTNAVKFTSQGSVTVTLGVTTEAPGDGIYVRVADTGPGIPAAEQARIFDPFVRLEPARNLHVPGVGLGLSLVHDLVENLGGVVKVRSEVGVGTTFDVFFPRTIPAPDLPGEEPSSDPGVR